MKKAIYVLNGPNLNRLGKREPQIYGKTTLAEVEAVCRKAAGKHALEFRQSNAEHELVDWIHEAKAQGLQLSYELIDLDKLGVGIEALPGLLADAKRRGLAGLNITYPCKQAVIPLLDDLSSEARALNAVNTLVIRDGRLTGHN